MGTSLLRLVGRLLIQGLEKLLFNGSGPLDLLLVINQRPDSRCPVYKRNSGMIYSR